MVRNWRGTAPHPCELCLVEAHLHESKFAVAREHLARTRAHCESYGENYLASEIDRLEAILATHEGAPIAVAKKYPICHVVGPNSGRAERTPFGRRYPRTDLRLVYGGFRHSRSKAS